MNYIGIFNLKVYSLKIDQKFLPSVTSSSNVPFTWEKHHCISDDDEAVVAFKIMLNSRHLFWARKKRNFYRSYF